MLLFQPAELSCRAVCIVRIVAQTWLPIALDTLQNHEICPPKWSLDEKILGLLQNHTVQTKTGRSHVISYA